MQPLRGVHSRRWIALCILVSMGATVVVPWARAAQGGGYDSYEDWVRGQLRVPAEGALKDALAEASAAKEESLDAFLADLIQAYAQRHPAQPLAKAFLPQAVSEDALVVYLTGRFHQLLSDAVLPPATLLTALAATAKTDVRSEATQAVFRHTVLRETPPATASAAALVVQHVNSFDSYGASQPRAP